MPCVIPGVPASTHAMLTSSCLWLVVAMRPVTCHRWRATAWRKMSGTTLRHYRAPWQRTPVHCTMEKFMFPVGWWTRNLYIHFHLKLGLFHGGARWVLTKRGPIHVCGVCCMSTSAMIITMPAACGYRRCSQWRIREMAAVFRPRAERVDQESEYEHQEGDPRALVPWGMSLRYRRKPP